MISCPTCARTNVNVVRMAQEVESRLDGLDPNLKIAVMGCIINGPGEAKDADFGLAGGKGKCAIFAKGTYVKTVDESCAVDELLSYISQA